MIITFSKQASTFYAPEINAASQSQRRIYTDDVVFCDMNIFS